MGTWGLLDKSLEGLLKRMSSDIDLLNRRTGRSSPVAGTTAARNTFYPTPTTAEEQAYLANQRIQWFNTDLGWMESYYAVTGTAGLNVPGLVADAAPDWYPLPGGGPRGRLGATGGQAHGDGTYFTAWNNFGSSSSAYESWRNSTLITRPLPDQATLQTNLAGRYDMSIRMTLPGGSGTDVWRFGCIDGLGNNLLTDQPAPLLTGYGQIGWARLEDQLLLPGGRCYMQTVTGSWTVGDVASYMEMRYLSPPLVSA